MANIVVENHFANHKNALNEIVNELQKNGIVFEGEYDGLDSMFLKQHITDVYDFLSKKSNRRIFATYVTPYFVIYDEKKFNNKSAEKLCNKVYEWYDTQQAYLKNQSYIELMKKDGSLY
mgnify:CR=1 FL=1